MNLELLNPFENQFPEVIEDSLEDGNAAACCCAPNRRGTLIAVGCTDGRVVIWDFDTRGIARVLIGHSHTITSLSWSRNGRKLLSASTDWTVKLWDVLSGNVEHSLLLDSAILFCQIHPRDPDQYLVLPMLDLPRFGNWKTGERKILPQHRKAQAKQVNKKQKMQVTAVSFNKRGDKIYTGDAKGFVTIIGSVALNIEHSFRIPGGSTIKSIQFSKSGKDFLLNCADRTLRAFDVDTLQHREFQDAVNRIQWKQCCFSCDGDFIIGGSAQKAEHTIYIWNRAFGRLDKILDGPKEGILDLVWHPLRPIIASVSTSGVVYIWATNYTENWSAFAPDFTELQENEEYEEREDEFDIAEDEDEQGPGKRRKRVDDPGEVDIMTIDKVTAYSSGEEDELWFIPIVLNDPASMAPIQQYDAGPMLPNPNFTAPNPNFTAPNPNATPPDANPNATPPDADANAVPPALST